ncbi:UDP-N-acetylmuramoyl-L-alanine--D-glutamate ligase [Isachenkonia alkalipeptolytica]|uniref:UDP-N-acetylmuramoylalanine--D-glutamate ligase n=1 Tax=Isachenkonia alkalipeptolytica TaxID=2565777 RepID=A0AA43XKI6_9CLOT|nr:UDP-N-acetylmuramoyl-L-alanine--D-glutamate ligase [Isachenkonia alkalipeptolytica]NBG88518.1 UDP-N-acetylmuramoyl-L-alanine--D-glutamate ligase [Isachenkonia alkalipeptolytica]
MNLKNKKVLIVGLATTGIPLVKVLKKLGAKVMITDTKSRKELQETTEKLKLTGEELLLGQQLRNLKEAGDPELVILSPGVPTEIPLVLDAKLNGIEVIGEIELAYRLMKGQLVAITGTNGKTTTTALTGEIIKKENPKTHIVGNIGFPMISKVLNSTEEDCFIAEVSSFQLESVKNFRPDIAAILNLTPDHLNRHKTMENYTRCKMNIFSNQRFNDTAIINYDDSFLRDATLHLGARKFYFSRLTPLEEGVFIKSEKITVKTHNKEIAVVDKKDLKILGEHNVENALAATAIAWSLGISIENIRAGLKSFKGVEHRMEVCGEVHGITFINDSKGTNPDASIKAVEAVNDPIILLAGGMDKGSDFEALIDHFPGRVKYLVVYGETAPVIEKTAKEKGFRNTKAVKNLEQAAKFAFDQGVTGDVILLSPACASWDMYSSYEKRGEHFKEIFKKLGRVSDD